MLLQTIPTVRKQTSSSLFLQFRPDRRGFAPTPLGPFTHASSIFRLRWEGVRISEVPAQAVVVGIAGSCLLLMLRPRRGKSVLHRTYLPALRNMFSHPSPR